MDMQIPLQETLIATENGSFRDDLPINNADFHSKLVVYRLLAMYLWDLMEIEWNLINGSNNHIYSDLFWRIFSGLY